MSQPEVEKGNCVRASFKDGSVVEGGIVATETPHARFTAVCAEGLSQLTIKSY